MLEQSAHSTPLRLSRLFRADLGDILALPEHPDLGVSLSARVAAEISGSASLRQALRGIQRWHAYTPSPSHPDANGLGHLVNTYVIAKHLTARDVTAGIITDAQAESLRVTALIHDFGELGVGDATYGKKTSEHERAEIAHFRANVGALLPGLSAEEHEQLVRLFSGIAFKGDPAMDLEAAYFNMIEVTGYATFGLEMFEERSIDFKWEVLGWRILRYHFFRENRDVPAHVALSEGARAWWRERLPGLDRMIEHYNTMDQQRFLDTTYRATAALSDYGTPLIRPIDFEVWPKIRGMITGEESASKEVAQMNSASTGTKAHLEVPQRPVAAFSWNIVDRAGVTPQQRERIVELLDMARAKREFSADPTWSHYPVGAAGCFGTGRVAWGSNFEYGGAIHGTGGTRAVHAEEALIADAKQRYGSDAKAEIVVYNTISTEPAYSCGNCIDVVRAHSVPDVLLVASISNGLAEIRRLSDIFPTSFPELTTREIDAGLAAAIQRTRAQALRGNQLFSQPSRGLSAAMVISQSGQEFLASPFDTASFHGRSAVEIAIGSAWGAQQGPPKTIILVTENRYVSGIERQFIFEAADTLGVAQELQILIVDRNGDGVFHTTPQGLLPFGFGPRSIGVLKD